VPFLAGLVKGGDAEVAGNAAGAIARLARRLPKLAPGAPSPVATAACPMLGDGRALVRANALAALAHVARRCNDGRVERKLLVEDASDLVRGDAARALLAAPIAEDRVALDRCAAADRSAEVARACRPALHPPLPALPPRAVTVFVVGEGATSAARPRASYVLEYADGVLRSGAADRRGAIFEPAAPAGEVILRRAPSP